MDEEIEKLLLFEYNYKYRGRRKFTIVEDAERVIHWLKKSGWRLVKRKDREVLTTLVFQKEEDEK